MISFCKQCVNRGKPTDFIFDSFISNFFFVVVEQSLLQGLFGVNKFLFFFCYCFWWILGPRVWFVFHCFSEIDFRSMFWDLFYQFFLSLVLWILDILNTRRIKIVEFVYRITLSWSLIRFIIQKSPVLLLNDRLLMMENFRSWKSTWNKQLRCSRRRKWWIDVNWRWTRFQFRLLDFFFCLLLFFYWI